jgi:hypothetical protein
MTKPKIRKRAVKIGKLTSPGLVAVEIGRVYRQARHGEIETIDAHRLATMLGVLAKALESERPIQHSIEITLREPEWLKTVTVQPTPDSKLIEHMDDIDGEATVSA